MVQHDPEVKAEALRRYLGEEPLRLIEQETGVSIRTQISWARSAGLPNRRGRAPKRYFKSEEDRRKALEAALYLRYKGRSMREIGDTLGLSPANMTRLLKGKRRGPEPFAVTRPSTLTPQQWDDFKRRYGTRERADKIAADYGVNVATVSAWAKRARLPRKPPAERGTGCGGRTRTTEVTGV